MFSFLFYLLTYSFSQTQEQNKYVCFQGGNALCPADHQYQIFHDSKQLTNYLSSNIDDHENTYTLFVANTRQEILFLNCSLLPDKINIIGYPDSYADIDFKYGRNSDKSKRNQIVTVKNLKVKSVRSQDKKNQNKLKALFLNLIDVTFLNQQPLKIKAKKINASFNSLKKVSKLEGHKIVRLTGLPKNANNEDLSLTIKIETKDLILDSFDDNASIDFISKEKSEDLTALLQFESFKNSVITFSAQKYDIFVKYETYLKFYYDTHDQSRMVSLSKDPTTKVNINVESEKAHVQFSGEKWSTKKHHKHHKHGYNSIEFDLKCSSNVDIESSSEHLPLNVNSCRNPHLIFNGLSASINSLELSNQGKAIIENRKNGGEVVIRKHVTFSPGANLQVHESVSKVRTHRIKSEFRSLPTQMSVNGHFEIESNEFEFLEYSVSFEYPPFSIKDTTPCFVVPADKNVFPIEIKKLTEGEKLNVRLSNDFLSGKFNEHIQTNIINKNINLFVNMKVDDFALLFPSNNHKQSGWNEQQQNLVTLQQNDQFVSLKISDLPSLYSNKICLFEENDEASRKACEKANLIPFQASISSSNKISDLTKLKNDVSIFVSSTKSEITLNLDNLESANIQSISNKEISTITIDNNNQESIKSLSLKDIKVNFADKNLHYNQLTLGFGTTIKEEKLVSFENVKKLNAYATVLKNIPKSRMKSKVVSFESIVESIKFGKDSLTFHLLLDNEFEVDYDDYNEDDYQFIYNKSNITLIKDCYRPSHFVLPLYYSDFHNNSKYIIVDSSFGNDNSVLDIEIQGENIRFLTYSTVIPFKYSDNLELIEFELGQYENVRAIDFVSELKIQKDSSLTLTTVSDEVNNLIKQNGIHINFNEIELKDRSSLISGNENFVFSKLLVDEDASVSLSGVTLNGELEVEGVETYVDISNSNLGSSTFNVEIKEDLYTIINLQHNSPLFKFDLKSIENSFKSINIHFKKYDHSLSSFNKSVKVFNLIEFEKPSDINCDYLSSLVTFSPSVFGFEDSGETIRFTASCNSENYVEVLGEIDLTGKITPAPSPDDDDDGDGDDTGINHSSKKKRNRIIALACACGSAVIIIVVAVAVALYLKKHYKEGDSEKAQMMVHLDPNNDQNVII